MFTEVKLRLSNKCISKKKPFQLQNAFIINYVQMKNLEIVQVNQFLHLITIIEEFYSLCSFFPMKG